MRKTLATINNETKGWLIVPFEVPQSVKKKKHTSKLKTTLPVSTTSIEFKTWQKECKWLQEGL